MHLQTPEEYWNHFKNMIFTSTKKTLKKKKRNRNITTIHKSIFKKHMSISLLLGKTYRAYREWISNIRSRTETLKEKIQNYILQINTPSQRIKIPILDLKENTNERLEMYKSLKLIQDIWKEESLIAKRIIKKEKDRNINQHIENCFRHLQDNPKKMINSILNKQP